MRKVSGLIVVLIFTIVFSFYGYLKPKIAQSGAKAKASENQNLPSKEATKEIAEFIANIKYEHLPPKIVEQVNKVMLDTLGVTIAGSSQKACPEIVDLVRSWGGKKESTILLYGDKVPAPNAAFANGPMARALDMGDCHPSGAHIGEYIVPALLPAAELKGGISGKEFITAFAVGAEVGCRIGASCGGIPGMAGQGRHPILGNFTATAAIANLFDLSQAEVENALGIAYHLTTATDLQMYSEGTLMVRSHHAFVCQDAINAVLLAQRGITGAHRIFSGKGGWFVRQCPRNRHPDILTKELGRTWEFLKDEMKAYAACKCNLPAITAAIKCVKENKIELEEIKKVDLVMNSTDANVVCKPRKQCWNPKNMVEAQFSMPFTVATGIIKGKVFVDDYVTSELEREDIKALMARINYTTDESLPMFSVICNITLKDGEICTKRVKSSEVTGAIDNPMTWADIVKKFDGCLNFSAVKINKENSNMLIKKCQHLEDVADVTELISLLTGK